MTDTNRGSSNTDFTNLTFDDIKNDLVNKARIYYPETYKDFNASSFGAMMIDLMAMVGEQLNFYAQFIANENYAETSRTTYSLTTHASTAGFKLKNTYSSTGTLQLYAYIPASLTDSAPDQRYKFRILKGATCTNNAGATFTTTQDAVVDFKKENIVGSHFSEDGSKNSYYTYEMNVPAKSGEVRELSVIVGTYQKFLKIEIKDDAASEILSVIDSNGNEFFEVENLSQNIVWKGLSDRPNPDPTRPDLMVPFPVPRRFTVEQEGDRTFLVFGFGSEKNIKTRPVADPSTIALKQPGRKYVSDSTFDPSRLLETDTFGVSPQNTTLTIRYRANTTENTNAAINTINNVQTAELVFDDITGLEQTKMDYIANITNISCNNKEPFNGSMTYTTKQEIVQKIKGAKGSQSRAVTLKDYASVAYIMPPKFGVIKRAAMVRDDNDFRRNLNLYVISQDSSGNLQQASSALKQNLRTWINSLRMVSDSIDIFDANIINLGIFFDIVSSDKINSASILSEVRQKLFDELTLATPEIGQSFSIGEVERILNSMREVVRVNSVKIVMKRGPNYSDTRHDIPSNVSPDGGLIYIPKNCIWEIKFADDITGKVQ